LKPSLAAADDEEDTREDDFILLTIRSEPGLPLLLPLLLLLLLPWRREASFDIPQQG
jgi:hypothetical protein